MAFFAVVAAIIFVVAMLRIMMVTPPETLAAFLRKAVPITMIAAGVGVSVAGRAAIGIPLAGFGIAAYRRLRPASPIGGSGGTSQVRGRYLDMVLDHDSGELEGAVLEGALAGARLSELSDEQLMELHREAADDFDSLRLLEAYLDRRMPAWREDAQARGGDGLGGAPGAGPMTEQQAYQILGLQPGATLAEVGEAHRRLMKRVHPDHGGTDFLAARINEAKAFLIERHR